MSETWRQNALTGPLWESMFYTLYTTVHAAILTPTVVVIVFAVLRVLGIRTLVQGTLFNRITSVAIGALVGGAPLRPTSSLVSIVIGALVIVGFSLLVDLAYVHRLVPGIFVHAKPVLLYIDGHMLTRQLKGCLLPPDRVKSAVRSHGISSMSKVYAVVLEPPGTFSVITREAAEAGLDMLQGVEGYTSHGQQAPAGDGGVAMMTGHAIRQRRDSAV